VLDRDDVNAGAVEGPGDLRVVGLDVAPDPVADLGGIWSGLASRVKGDDLTSPDRGGEIVSERSDAASMRGIR
jgi:hypothetical protein